MPRAARLEKESDTILYDFRDTAIAAPDDRCATGERFGQYHPKRLMNRGQDGYGGLAVNRRKVIDLAGAGEQYVPVQRLRNEQQQFRLSLARYCSRKLKDRPTPAAFDD